MTTTLFVSYVLLWTIVLLLVFGFFVVARQIGLLHSRLAPVGARMTQAGPEVGEVFPASATKDIYGADVTIGGLREKPLFIVFVSPTCSSCSELMEGFVSLWKSEHHRLDFLAIAITGNVEVNRQFIADHGLSGIPYVISFEIAKACKVLSPPYGVFLDERGIVKAKGITNNFDHLESLINAGDLNEPSAESYLQKQLLRAAAVAGGSEVAQ